MVLGVAPQNVSKSLASAASALRPTQPMIVSTKHVSLAAGQSAMQMFIAAPNRDGKFPGILLYSDIFQLTAPTLRSAVRLAGYGFVVAAPEIYHRLEPQGTVIPFDDEGRDRGLA